MGDIEYYGLSFLRKTEDGAEWEKIYIEIGGTPKIIAHIPQTREMRTLNSKIEKISKEDISKLLKDLAASDKTY